MKTTIRKMGNSQGVLIPKHILSEAGLESEVEMTVEDGSIVLRKAHKVRQGWADASQDIASAGDDALVWPDAPNEQDDEWQW